MQYKYKILENEFLVGVALLRDFPAFEKYTTLGLLDIKKNEAKSINNKIIQSLNNKDNDHSAILKDLISKSYLKNLDNYKIVKC